MKSYEARTPTVEGYEITHERSAMTFLINRRDY